MRVLLADDHCLFLQGIRALLAGVAGLEVVGEARTGLEAVRLCRETKPDVAIMDIAMPELNGVEATRMIVGMAMGVRVLCLSVHASRRFILEMLKAGASGYLLKTCDLEELAVALKVVFQGKIYISPSIAWAVVDRIMETGAEQSPSEIILSPREREVLQLLVEGRRPGEIAQALCVSEKTVHSHRRNISEKLGLRTLPELTKYAIQQGLTGLHL